jgi:hypothetical protein
MLARPDPPWADRFIIGVAPIDYGPGLLLRPFAFHLAMDTLPSGVRPRNSTFFPLSGQRGITPAFGYGAPHPGARGTLTLRSNVLLSTHCGRSDSCPPRGAKCSGSSQRPLPPLLDQQVSLIHALSLPALPSPTTCGCSALPGHVTHPQVEPRLLPHGIFPNRNSELHPSLAGSPHHAGRIEFSFLPYLGDFLRTGRSPPAALHPVSRRRRCSRLQVTLTWRGLPPLRLSAPHIFNNLSCGRRYGGAEAPAFRPRNTEHLAPHTFWLWKHSEAASCEY